MLLVVVGFLLWKIISISGHSTAAIVSSGNVSCIEYYDLKLTPVINDSKGCLQLCCKPQQRYNGYNTCISIKEAPSFTTKALEYYDNDTAQMLKEFTVAFGKPCENMKKYQFFNRMNYPHWTSIVESVT